VVCDGVAGTSYRVRARLVINATGARAEAPGTAPHAPKLRPPRGSHLLLPAWRSWAEHDAEGYWQAVCQACQGLWAEHGVDKASVRGVAVTTQRGTGINLAKDGKPLRAAITWLDQRRTSEVPPMSAFWGRAMLEGLA
jgi:ribulose kinase